MQAASKYASIHGVLLSQLVLPNMTRNLRLLRRRRDFSSDDDATFRDDDIYLVCAAVQSFGKGGRV